MSQIHALLAVTIGCTVLVANGENVVAQSNDTSEAIERTESLGPVSAKIRLSPSKPLIGDPIELLIQVTAEQDVELLMPEFGEALDRFRILDFAPIESIDSQGNTVSAQKYRLQPPFSGKQSIPQILVEFVDRRAGQKQAPEGFDAYELLLPRIDFEVQSVVPTNATSELKPPLGELNTDFADDQAFWPWLIALLVGVAAIVAPFVVKRVGKNRAIARRISAYEVARRRLDTLIAKPRPQGEEVNAFFVELSDIVRQYLEARFDLRAPELTTEEFMETVIDSPDLSRDHQTLLRDFLKQADLVKFAGFQPDDKTIQDSIAAADRFILETRANDDDGKTRNPATLKQSNFARRETEGV